MLPNIFRYLSDFPGVVSTLGVDDTGAIRLYTEHAEEQAKWPVYAVWSVSSGRPYLNLSEPANMDSVAIRLDVYGTDLMATRAAAIEIRKALEKRAYVVSWLTDYEPRTKRHIFLLDVDWHQET